MDERLQLLLVRRHAAAVCSSAQAASCDNGMNDIHKLDSMSITVRYCMRSLLYRNSGYGDLSTRE